jgi:hypothetical protein
VDSVSAKAADIKRLPWARLLSNAVLLNGKKRHVRFGPTTYHANRVQRRSLGMSSGWCSARPAEREEDAESTRRLIAPSAT